MNRLEPLSIYQRNFLLGVLNGLLFTTAETLIDPTLVLVTFISRLTPSPILIGLIAPLRDAGWALPQLWVSGYFQNQPYKLALYRRTALVRVLAWGALALLALLAPARGVMLIAFFAAFGTYAFASGVGGLAFTEVVGKTIPAQRRVVFFAWRLFTGGLAALGAAALVRVLLADTTPLGFPYNFGVLFALGWVAAAAGLFAFQAIQEPPDSALRPRASGWQQLQRAWAAVRRDPVYRPFIILRSAQTLAGAAVPFFAVYVQTHLGGALDMVGIYLAAFTVASLLANALLGRYAGRLDNRRIMLLATLAGLLLTFAVLALLAAARWSGVSGALAGAWLVPVFALSGVRESALGVASQPLLLEIAPAEDRSLYLGFTNTLLGVMLLTTGFSGVLVATLGFPVLVAFSLAAYVLAAWAGLQLYWAGQRGLGNRIEHAS